MILILIALMVSALFSYIETVFITFDKLKLFIWLKRRDFFAKTLGLFFPREERFVITSLVGLNIANVAFSSFTAVYLVSRGIPPELVVAISTVIILIFAEILPKAFAMTHSTFIIRPASVLLGFFYLLFLPLVLVLNLILKLFLKFNLSDRKLVLSRERLKNVLLRREVELDLEDVEITASVLSFAAQKMREVMTPRTDIIAVPLNSSLDEIKELVIESGHSKIPLYRDNIDHIEGYIHALDLMTGESDLKNIIRTPEFVSEFTPVIEALQILKRKHAGMLVVLDEYGGVDGIATIEDITEELFGEIEDEYDHPKFQYRTLREGSILISGRAEIDTLNREMDLELDKPEGVETFGGWLVTKLGRIPHEREKVRVEGLLVEVLLSDEKSVKTVKIRKNRT